MSEKIIELPKPTLIEDLGMMYANEKSKHKTRFGLYKCGFCGKEFKTSISRVNTGNNKSCGCFKKGTPAKHNLAGTKLYNVWKGIKRRVTNINSDRYKYYGGKGITICEEWKNDFKSFYDWAMSNGYEEDKGLSIDRIDNDGNYCPENCRWTTQTIQNRNQGIRKDNKSGFKGVWYKEATKKYIVGIRINKITTYLGSFLTAVEGAIAYNNYIIENNLEGFILNEIPEDYLNQNTKE